MVEEEHEPGWVGKHTCSCCGYTCDNRYKKGFAPTAVARNKNKSKETQGFLLAFDEMYKSGMTGKEIASELGVSKDTLYRRLRFNQVDFSRLLTYHTAEDFRRTYTEFAEMGLSMRQIAVRMGLRYSYVHRRSLEVGAREPMANERSV